MPHPTAALTSCSCSCPVLRSSTPGGSCVSPPHFSLCPSYGSDLLLARKCSLPPVSGCSLPLEASSINLLNPKSMWKSQELNAWIIKKKGNKRGEKEYIAAQVISFFPAQPLPDYSHLCWCPAIALGAQAEDREHLWCLPSMPLRGPAVSPLLELFDHFPWSILMPLPHFRPSLFFSWEIAKTIQQGPLQPT